MHSGGGGGGHVVRLGGGGGGIPPFLCRKQDIDFEWSVTPLLQLFMRPCRHLDSLHSIILGMTSFKARLMQRWTQRRAVIWAKTRTIGRMSAAHTRIRTAEAQRYGGMDNRVKTAAVTIEDVFENKKDDSKQAGMYRSLGPLRGTERY